MKQLLLTFALLAVQLASAQTTDYDTNRGFIHPGGLHTQADFDRVKAQLEAGNPTVIPWRSSYAEAVRAKTT